MDNTTELQRVLDEVSRALNGLRFGSVEIVIHDGRVVQIERHEKIRLSAGDTRNSPGSR